MLHDYLLGLALTFYTLFAGYILYQAKKDPYAMLLCNFSLASAFWGGGILFFRILPWNYQILFSLNQLFIVSAAFIASFFLHLAIVYSRQLKKLSLSKTILIHLPNLFIFGISFIPGILIQDLVQQEWGRESILGWGYIYFGIYIIAYFLFGLFELSKAYLKATPKIKTRLTYILVATFITGNIDIFFNLILILLGNYKYIWVGPTSGFLWCIIMIYAITKHELLDISIIITRTSAIAIGLIPVISLTTALTFIPKDSPFFLYAIFTNLLFWIFVFPKMTDSLQTTLKKRFTENFHDVEKTLKNISGALVFAQQRWDVFESLAREFKNALEAQKVFVLFPLQEGSEVSPEFHLFVPNTRVDKKADKDEESLDFLPEYSPLISYFLFGPELALLDELPPIVREQLRDYGVHRHAVVIPIHAQGKLQGIIILDRKLSETRYSSGDLKFLDAIKDQVAVVFDRIVHQELLHEANLALQVQEKLLQERVIIEERQKKQAIHVAQELAHQASFSTLTLGIAHEIRNPLSAMQTKAVHLRDRLTGKHMPHANVSPNIHMWNRKVSKDRLRPLLDNRDDLTDLVWDHLLENHYIRPDGMFNEKSFRPFSPLFAFELPPEALPFETALLNQLMRTYIQSKVLGTLDIFDSESSRVERICQHMMEYGVTGMGVANTAFTDLVGAKESDLLWQELVASGYLDENGMIMDKFMPDDHGFELELSDQFKQYESYIRHILDHSERAKKVQINVNEFLDNISELFEGKFKRSKITIVTEFEEAVPPLFGHWDDLKQAILNIFTNAQQAMEACPERIHTFTVKTAVGDHPLRDEGQERCLEIQFEDTGCGIPEETLPKIMDPFFSTKGVTGGQNIGLGLSIVHQTIQRMGGRIMIETVEGQGTVFRLLFPIVSG